jgi:hypothetical protein
MFARIFICACILIVGGAGTAYSQSCDDNTGAPACFANPNPAAIPTGVGGSRGITA